MGDMQTLDVDAVRAFVAVAELQSFTRAAEALARRKARSA
jgi:DNA-binding transcriptional LysR family regulator